MIPYETITIDELFQHEPKIVAVDTETNAQDIRDGRGYAIGVSIAFLDKDNVLRSGYFPFRDHGMSDNLIPFEKNRILNDWLRDKILIFHNAKFDLVSLQTLGIYVLSNKFYCTMLMCHLIDENLPYEKSLNACVIKYVDKNEKKERDALFEQATKSLGWNNIPVEIMAPYARYDAVLTFKLFHAIQTKFHNEVKPEYWWHKQDFLKVIIAMESRGVKVDVALCNKLAAQGHFIMEDLKEELGGNPASPIFLKEILIDRLKLPVLKKSPKTGKPSFAKEVMEQYDELLEPLNNPTALQIKQYRGWQKSVSSNYEPYVNLLSPDGRLRPNYKLHGTKTGRMSCSLPNLQQIPRVSDKPWNGHMKSAFIPEPGYVLIEADYSQLELRLGTAYAKELALMQVFEEGRDIFTEMSQRLGMSRQDTKTFVYSVQYGAGVTRISNVFGISPDAAEEMRSNYYDTYPGFKRVTENAKKVCYRDRKVPLWSGRNRHFMWPEEEAHKAFNSIIQGGAADIVEHVMVRLFNEVDDEVTCRMLLQVHDSVVFEIREDYLDEKTEQIRKVMSDVRPDFGVKFTVDIHKWGN